MVRKSSEAIIVRSLEELDHYRKESAESSAESTKTVARGEHSDKSISDSHKDKQ